MATFYMLSMPRGFASTVEPAFSRALGDTGRWSPDSVGGDSVEYSFQTKAARTIGKRAAIKALAEAIEDLDIEGE